MILTKYLKEKSYCVVVNIFPFNFFDPTAFARGGGGWGKILICCIVNVSTDYYFYLLKLSLSHLSLSLSLLDRIIAHTKSPMWLKDGDNFRHCKF